MRDHLKSSALEINPETALLGMNAIPACLIFFAVEVSFFILMFLPVTKTTT